VVIIAQKGKSQKAQRVTTKLKRRQGVGCGVWGVMKRKVRITA